MKFYKIINKYQHKLNKSVSQLSMAISDPQKHKILYLRMKRLNTVVMI